MHNERGQSLVQILVSIGIMGIMLTAMISSQNLQRQENRALTEKLAAMDLTRAITAVLGGPGCDKLFDSGNLVSGNTLTFDANAVSTNSPFVITLNSVPSTSGPTLVNTGQPVSALSTTLNVKASTGIQVQVVSSSTAYLKVNFEQTRLVRAITDLTFPLTLKTTGASSAMTITGCASLVGASSFGGTYIVTNAGCNKVNPVTGTLGCPPGFNDAGFFTYMGRNDNSCGAVQDQFFTHYCWK